MLCLPNLILDVISVVCAKGWELCPRWFINRLLFHSWEGLCKLSCVSYLTFDIVCMELCAIFSLLLLTGKLFRSLRNKSSNGVRVVHYIAEQEVCRFAIHAAQFRLVCIRVCDDGSQVSTTVLVQFPSMRSYPAIHCSNSASRISSWSPMRFYCCSLVKHILDWYASCITWWQTWQTFVYWW